MTGPAAAILLFLRLLLAMAVNAVVIAGFFRGGWSPGTVLALYWVQTVIAIPLTALLVVLHRRASRKLGHYRIEPGAAGGPAQVKAGPFLGSFLSAAAVFAAAHGFFLGIILGVMLRGGDGALDWHDVRSGASLIAAMLLAGFLADLPGLGSKPFAWIRHRTETLLRRVVLTHFVIIFGMFAAALADRQATAFFGVFIAFKLLADLAGELPAWDPKEAPGWLAALGNRLGDGRDLRAEWRRMRAERLQSQAQAERTLEEALPGNQ